MMELKKLRENLQLKNWFYNSANYANINANWIWLNKMTQDNSSDQYQLKNSRP